MNIFKGNAYTYEHNDISLDLLQLLFFYGGRRLWDCLQEDPGREKSIKIMIK